MGQYHVLVNLDRREFVHAHELSLGLKAWEQLASSASTPHLMFALSMTSNGRGGGDLDSHELVGRWAGDRVVIVGDYAEMDDLPNGEAVEAHTGASRARLARLVDDAPLGTGPCWTSIAELCRDWLTSAFGVVYEEEVDHGHTYMRRSWPNEKSWHRPETDVAALHTRIAELQARVERLDLTGNGRSF